MPTPVTDKNRRREMVEELMLRAVPNWRIAEELAKKLGLSERLIKLDIRRVRRRWELEQAKAMKQIRTNRIRNLQRIAREAERAGEYHAAVAAFALASKIQGMVAAESVQRIKVTFGTLPSAAPVRRITVDTNEGGRNGDGEGGA